MRNIITRSCITMLMLLLLAVPALAAGRQPQRIAQFPLVIESWQQPDASVQDQLETKIDRALHVRSMTRSRRSSSFPRRTASRPGMRRRGS